MRDGIHKNEDLPAVLTIAGFDPTGEAGIIADVRTIEALGCRSLAVITSVTFQNSQNVFGALHQSRDSLHAQIAALAEESHIAAVKTGMLPTREIVVEAARLLSERDLPRPVLDPVFRSTSEFDLIEENAIEPLINELLPAARLITPNIPEAERLTGLPIYNEADMREAAGKLRNLGARAVLIKGGHLSENGRGREQAPREAIDILDDNGKVTLFRGEWIHNPNRRGTGCMLSSAIAAGLAQNKSLEESVRVAKQFVADAIRFALHSTRSATIA